MERSQALRVGAAGALGGAVNATLCYLGWPVPIAHADFGWHIIPAGLVHGGVLAASAARSAYFAAGIRTRWRWSIALPIAWIVGYISWMPLSVSLLKEWDPDVLLWPFDAQHPFNATWGPIAYFGAVAGLLYLWLAYRGTRPSVARDVAAGVFAGGAGSLWFWCLYEHWYLSIIHGAVWGVLVGGTLQNVGRSNGRSRRTRG